MDIELHNSEVAAMHKILTSEVNLGFANDDTFLFSQLLYLLFSCTHRATFSSVENGTVQCESLTTCKNKCFQRWLRTCTRILSNCVFFHKNKMLL